MLREPITDREEWNAFVEAIFSKFEEACMPIPTVKIRNPDAPGYIIINDFDYDPDTMKLYDGPDGSQANPHAQSVQTVAGDMQIDGIVATIRELQARGDDEDFTATGKPQVSAIERELGIDITAGQRDEAWKRMQDGAQ